MAALLQVATGPLPPAAVRDTIAAVFAHPDYDTSLRRSIGDRILDWIARLITAAYDAIRGSADVRWIVIGAAAVVVILVVARAFYLAGATAAKGRGRQAAGTPRVDPWHAAAEAAGHGRYDAAVHLLYVAVLEELARRHRIRLHPSRTPREYERELRARSPSALPAFAAFVREYEPVVWRNRASDRETYRRLEALARVVATAEARGAAA